jgi:hypothetical protein
MFLIQLISIMRVVYIQVFPPEDSKLDIYDYIMSPSRFLVCNILLMFKILNF